MAWDLGLRRLPGEVAGDFRYSIHRWGPGPLELSIKGPPHIPPSNSSLNNHLPLQTISPLPTQLSLPKRSHLSNSSSAKPFLFFRSHLDLLLRLKPNETSQADIVSCPESCILQDFCRTTAMSSLRCLISSADAGASVRQIDTAYFCTRKLMVTISKLSTNMPGLCLCLTDTQGHVLTHNGHP